MSKELTQHFLSAAWPPMPQEDWEALREDIEVNGQRMPIVIYEGQVLDGWQRYTCLRELHREPDVIELGEGEDPAAFVRSVNKHRRHSTASQRAMAEVEMSKWRPRGKSAPGADLGAKSTAQMASNANASKRTIEAAKEVAAKATPEVVAAVKAGEVSVKKAAAALKPKKPKAPILPKVEDEEKDDADLEEWKARTIEGQRLIAEKDEEIRRLCAEDGKADLLVAVQQYHHANGRVHDLCRKETEILKTLKYCQRVLTDVRKLLGVEKNSQIVAAILAMKKGANEF